MNRYIIGSLWDRVNRNGANANFEYLFEGRQKIDELNYRADGVLKEAERTNNMNRDVQNQLDALIIESGNANAEVSQARGGLPLLKDRLDKVDTRLADLSINIMEFEHLKVVRGNGYDWQPVFQAAVNYAHAQGGGKLYAPKKVYELYDSIEWETNISLFGAGIGKTILRPIGNNLSAIKQVNEEKYNKDNPLEDVMFVDFEVDGTGFTNTTHAMAVKGLFILYMRRASFLNLYIHDTIGTGLGCDFLDQTVIHNVLAENCGRNWGIAGGIGGAGIGIGTGVWETETLTISNCHTIGNGSNGIFVEKQGNSPYAAKGIRIVDCTAINNRGSGIQDKGVTDLLVQGCTMQGNGGVGYKGNANIEASEGMLYDNVIRDNAEHGVSLGQLYKGHYTLRGNKISGNGGRGVIVSVSSATLPNLTLKGNKIHDNKQSGVDLTSNSDGLIENLFIEDNDIFRNGVDALARGIEISANVKNITSKGNNFFDGRNQVNQHRGIRLSSARSITNGFITDNTFRDAPLGIEMLGHMNNVIVNNNPGHKTEAYGSVTFAVGEEIKDIPHGLVSKPNSIIVNPRSAVFEQVWVRDEGLVNIVLKRTGTVGELRVYWEAKV